MRRIALITNSFPFPPGEQFLEEEIKYWGQSGAQIQIFPLRIIGSPRKLPEGVTVDTFLGIATSHKWKIWLFILKIMAGGILYRELRFLLDTRMLTYRTLRRASISTVRTLYYAGVLRHYIKRAGAIDVLYCYWNDTTSYAACLVKRTGGIQKIVTRVHGYDLYQERRQFAYMPLKRQFVSDFDRVYAVSSQGRDYFVNTYGARADRVTVAPLGVAVHDGALTECVAGCMHIVSLSFCVSVKRIDKIIDAVAVFASRNPGLAISWTHIGGGPLQEPLCTLAGHVLSGLDNVTFDFKGSLANDVVRRYLASCSIDLFVNASESEGVPVSVMEAMAAGIPTVAPDVGGVSELVSNDCGYLLSPCPSAEEIAKGMSYVYFHADKSAIRCAAKEKIRRNFNVARNYPAFVADVQDLLEAEGFSRPM